MCIVINASLNVINAVSLFLLIEHIYKRFDSI